MHDGTHLFVRLRDTARDYWSSLKAERGAERAINWIGRLALVNFAGFALLTNYFGGDALNGFEASGRFFLKMGMRPPVEVSAGLYRFMYWYAIVLIVHVAAACLIGLARSRKDTAATGWSPSR